MDHLPLDWRWDEISTVNPLELVQWCLAPINDRFPAAPFLEVEWLYGILCAVQVLRRRWFVVSLRIPLWCRFCCYRHELSRHSLVRLGRSYFFLKRFSRIEELAETGSFSVWKAWSMVCSNYWFEKPFGVRIIRTSVELVVSYFPLLSNAIYSVLKSSRYKKWKESICYWPNGK